jgi:hypothetical protein
MRMVMTSPRAWFRTLPLPVTAAEMSADNKL